MYPSSSTILQLQITLQYLPYILINLTTSYKQHTLSFTPLFFLFIYREKYTHYSSIPHTSFISFITNREIGYITRYHLLLQAAHSFIHSSLLSILFVERNTPTSPVYHTHHLYPLLLTGKSVT